MKYEDIFGRSFRRQDQKRVGFSALVACFLITWCLCTVFKPYIVLSLRLTIVDGLKLVVDTDKTSKHQVPCDAVKKRTLICDTSQPRSDTCEIKGDIRIHGNSSTILVLSSHNSTINASWTIKPYARKGDESAMESVTNFTIKLVQTMPKCTKTHNISALVFSTGGYAGNHFHAFTDVIFPLYITSRDFNRDVQFLVANRRSLWTSKFEKVLDKLSKYEIIDIDHENEVHCFPNMIVGLRKELLDLKSVMDFKSFLRTSYSLERSTTKTLKNSLTTKYDKPRILIVSRQKTRGFTNMQDVIRATEESGFEVVVSELNSNMTHVSRVVNSCDVIMGVHGAGLTNMVFLPENGVLIQVVPWGEMSWLANTCFGEPSKAMGLKYLEYKIGEEESSLIDEYPRNHQVFSDPYSIQNKGWDVYKSIYLDKQNVKLNVTSFKQTLSTALQILTM